MIYKSFVLISASKRVLFSEITEKWKPAGKRIIIQCAFDCTLLMVIERVIIEFNPLLSELVAYGYI